MKKLISFITVSAAAIIIGFGIMVLPFHLFNNLTNMQMRILFITETAVYFAVFCTVCLIREAKIERAKKEQAFQKRRRERILERERELKGLNISGTDFAA